MALKPSVPTPPPNQGWRPWCLISDTKNHTYLLPPFPGTVSEQGYQGPSDMPYNRWGTTRWDQETGDRPMLGKARPELTSAFP